MKKEEIIHALENARETHLREMDKIKSLLRGKEVKDMTPMSKTKCVFGKWLLNDKEQIMSFLGAQFYEILDTVHGTWHMEYAKIHMILKQENKKGFLSNIFGSHQVDVLELEKAKVYYKDLELITKEILRVLDASQRRVQALNKSKFH